MSMSILVQQRSSEPIINLNLKPSIFQCCSPGKYPLGGSPDDSPCSEGEFDEPNCSSLDEATQFSNDIDDGYATEYPSSITSIASVGDGLPDLEHPSEKEGQDNMEFDVTMDSVEFKTAHESSFIISEEVKEEWIQGENSVEIEFTPELDFNDFECDSSEPTGVRQQTNKLLHRSDSSLVKSRRSLYDILSGTKATVTDQDEGGRISDTMIMINCIRIDRYAEVPSQSRPRTHSNEFRYRIFAKVIGDPNDEKSFPRSASAEDQQESRKLVEEEIINTAEKNDLECSPNDATLDDMTEIDTFASIGEGSENSLKKLSVLTEDPLENEAKEVIVKFFVRKIFALKITENVEVLAPQLITLNDNDTQSEISFTFHSLDDIPEADGADLLLPHDKTCDNGDVTTICVIDHVEESEEEGTKSRGSSVDRLEDAGFDVIDDVSSLGDMIGDTSSTDDRLGDSSYTDDEYSSDDIVCPLGVEENLVLEARLKDITDDDVGTIHNISDTSGDDELFDFVSPLEVEVEDQSLPEAQVKVVPEDLSNVKKMIRRFSSIIEACKDESNAPVSVSEFLEDEIQIELLAGIESSPEKPFGTPNADTQFPITGQKEVEEEEIQVQLSEEVESASQDLFGSQDDGGQFWLEITRSMSMSNSMSDENMKQSDPTNKGLGERSGSQEEEIHSLSKSLEGIRDSLSDTIDLMVHYQDALDTGDEAQMCVIAHVEEMDDDLMRSRGSSFDIVQDTYSDDDNDNVMDFAETSTLEKPMRDVPIPPIQIDSILTNISEKQDAAVQCPSPTNQSFPFFMEERTVTSSEILEKDDYEAALESKNDEDHEKNIEALTECAATQSLDLDIQSVPTNDTIEDEGIIDTSTEKTVEIVETEKKEAVKLLLRSASAGDQHERIELIEEADISIEEQNDLESSPFDIAFEDLLDDEIVVASASISERSENDIGQSKKTVKTDKIEDANCHSVWNVNVQLTPCKIPKLMNEYVNVQGSPTLFEVEFPRKPEKRPENAFPENTVKDHKKHSAPRKPVRVTNLDTSITTMKDGLINSHDDTGNVSDTGVMKRNAGVSITRNHRYVNIPSNRVHDLGEGSYHEKPSSFKVAESTYMIIPISNVIESVIVDGHPTFFDFVRQVTRV